MNTPDELRKWANGYELQGRHEIAGLFRAAADAWGRLELQYKAANEHIGKLAADLTILRKRLEAAEKTIGTLQADRIKAQATIDHYRTMLEAVEKQLPPSDIPF
jgi:chromosome segregation ATPase